MFVALGHWWLRPGGPDAGQVHLRRGRDPPRLRRLQLQQLRELGGLATAVPENIERRAAEGGSRFVRRRYCIRSEISFLFPANLVVSGTMAQLHT